MARRPAAWLVLLGALALPVPAGGVLGAGESVSSPIIARWLFDEGNGQVASDGVDGSTNGKIVKATWTDGRSGGALAFEDYSLRNYLKPDVKEATRVVVPHGDRLNPTGPFTLRTIIYPTRDPLFYGGILEKGRGYGASYRLLLLRGLKVRATAGSAGTAVTSSEPISLNAWHEIELKYDGSQLILKVDGKEQGRSPGVRTPLASKDDLLIGERFSGKIDEILLTAP